jgi:hypothetical protein
MTEIAPKAQEEILFSEVFDEVLGRCGRCEGARELHPWILHGPV